MKKNIELRCPLCGSSINVYEKESFCYCKQCKKDFQITREGFDHSYTLSPVKVRDKSIYKPNYLIIFTVVFFFAFFAWLYLVPIFTPNMVNEQSPSYTDDDLSLLKNINDIKESDLDVLDESSEGKILVYSRFEETSSLQIDRYSVVLLTKENGNLLILTYKVNYYDDLFYVPLVYTDVMFNHRSKSILNNLYPPTVDAPTIYLKSDKSIYTIGYRDYDDIYNYFIKPNLVEYTISE